MIGIGRDQLDRRRGTKLSTISSIEHSHRVEPEVNVPDYLNITIIVRPKAPTEDHIASTLFGLQV